MAGIAPFPKHQLFDNNGDPAAGYKLFCYEAGTTTKQDTFSDAGLTTPNANPIVLDSAGRATIFLNDARYKFVLAPPTDTDPPVSPVWTVDSVAATAAFDVSLAVDGIAGEGAIGPGSLVFLSDGSGGLTAGRWYRPTFNPTPGYTAPILGYSLTETFAAGDTMRIQVGGRVSGLSSLTAGARYYLDSTGALTTTTIGNARLVGVADTTTSLLLTASPLQYRELRFEFGTPGAGVLATGVRKYVPMPFACIVQEWTIVAEQSGSIVIDVWSDTYANFPPTVADTIAGSEKPTLTAAQKNQDLSLTTWTTFIPRNNVLGLNIDSVATVNYVCLTLGVWAL